MNIYRTHDPRSLEYMIPNFILRSDDDVERELLGIRLAKLMVECPESINVLQAWDGENLIGFIIGTIGPDSSFVWIAQGWSKSGNKLEIADELFMRILMWTMAMGRTKVKAETSRDLSAMYRRFGFKPVATIVERVITEDETTMILERGKELIHG